MKKMRKALTFVMALVLALGSIGVSNTTAVKADDTTAYICYADSAWSEGGQYWGSDAPANVTVSNATVTGYGQYTVGLAFTEAVAGLAFTDIQLDNGEALYPGAIMRIDEVTINGAAVTLTGTPYTSSDDGTVTRVNLYNAWVGSIPDDARTASGSLDDATPVALNPDDCASVSSMTVTFTLLPAAEVYLDWVNADWSVSNWSAEGAEGITVEPAVITGNGTYTTSISFASPIDGIAFAALIMDRGEAAYPNSVMNIDSIKINGEAVEYAKGYTTYDNDGSYQTRVNIYNAWVSELPEDVRTADGDNVNVTPTMISADITGVSSVEVTFTLSTYSTYTYKTPTMEAADTLAYICYADSAWSEGGQYWGSDVANIKATNAVIPAEGWGTYTVGLEFTEPVAGLAFADLKIENGDLMYPNAVVTIDEVTVNGAAITLNGTPYTSSDDGVETRVNLYNAWVGEIPSDARTASGSLDDATPTAMSADDFASVSSMTVTFTLAPATQVYLDWVNADWSVSNWSAAGADGITVEPAVVYAPGSYSTKISFANPIDGVAFAALIMDRGENVLPYIAMNIDKILVNGEAIDFAKGYTTYDNDGSYQTRTNIYNAWVSELPEDVRTADGDNVNVTPTMISGDITGVSSVEVFFTVVQTEAPVVEEAAEAEPVVYSGEYHAYMQVQTNTSLWIFRNNWDDSTYGLGTEEYDGGLYDTTNKVHYAGTFNDVVIDGDGTYTISLTGADFQTEDYMSILAVSTDIPVGGEAKISNVIVNVNGKDVYTFAEGYESPDSKTYLNILCQNYWNSDVKDLFTIFTAAGSVKDIAITFTVSGLGYEGTGSADTADTTEATDSITETAAPTEAPTAAPTEAPAADTAAETAETAESGSTGTVVVIIVAVVIIAAALIYFLVIKKKNKK